MLSWIVFQTEKAYHKKKKNVFQKKDRKKKGDGGGGGGGGGGGVICRTQQPGRKTQMDWKKIKNQETSPSWKSHRQKTNKLKNLKFYSKLIAISQHFQNAVPNTVKSYNYLIRASLNVNDVFWQSTPSVQDDKRCSLAKHAICSGW